MGVTEVRGTGGWGPDGHIVGGEVADRKRGARLVATAREWVILLSLSQASLTAHCSVTKTPGTTSAGTLSGWYCVEMLTRSTARVAPSSMGPLPHTRGAARSLLRLQDADPLFSHRGGSGHKCRGTAGLRVIPLSHLINDPLRKWPRLWAAINTPRTHCWSHLRPLSDPAATGRQRHLQCAERAEFPPQKRQQPLCGLENLFPDTSTTMRYWLTVTNIRIQPTRCILRVGTSVRMTSPSWRHALAAALTASCIFSRAMSSLT
jgi:hypothetical protein